MIAVGLTAGPPTCQMQSWLGHAFQLSWGMAKAGWCAQGKQEKYGFLSAFQIFKVLHELRLMLVIGLGASLNHC